MPDSHLSVLGRVSLTVDDHDVPITSPTQRRLLLRLAVDASQAVSVDAIADSIWGVELPRDPTNAVRYHVWKLRDAIGETGPEVVATTPGGYLLSMSREAIDACLFESLISEAAESATIDPERSLTHVEQALLLWHGTPYADADDAEFAQPEIRRLTEARPNPC